MQRLEASRTRPRSVDGGSKPLRGQLTQVNLRYFYKVARVVMAQVGLTLTILFISVSEKLGVQECGSTARTMDTGPI